MGKLPVWTRGLDGLMGVADIRRNGVVVARMRPSTSEDERAMFIVDACNAAERARAAVLPSDK